jgi:hypothetical protein
MGEAKRAHRIDGHGLRPLPIPRAPETHPEASSTGVVPGAMGNYSVKKGFLAQAKRQEPGKPLATSEWKRMQAQCNTMLNFTSDSYVFIYSLNGVFVVPAISVAACQAVEDLHTLHPKNLSAFYKEHFMCFVGDRAIDSASPRVLDNLLARVAFEITASASNDRDLFTDDEGDA